MQHPTFEYIQLDPEHSPLVELAMRLGYVVSFYQNEQTKEGASQHYRIDNGLGRSNESEDLIDALAFMIKRDMLSFTTPTT